MRLRFQRGSLARRDGAWVGQWREDGHRRKRALGLVSEMTKSRAQAALAAILAGVNARRQDPSQKWLFGEFVGQVYLPFYRRKWKRSTMECNDQRVKYHLVAEFGQRELASVTRDELQGLLDRKAATGLSYSV